MMESWALRPSHQRDYTYVDGNVNGIDAAMAAERARLWEVGRVP